ncbi:hypothetical protein H2204_004081 [Knufia peltigerae]|uniref:Ankyrin repeat protein n=1 Tax=Knufia peltigerae TaxID=1002370 RepID=A0AA38Y7T7_9EURO|nr:hypothetical protein H2204_004081 [Knufia peltigerae]
MPSYGSFSSAEVMETAVKNEDLFAIIDLLNQGIKPTKHEFVNAVEQKSYSILELFLDDGYELNEPLRDDYPPPLAVAISDPSLTKWLLQRGADPNARCRFDITPLSIAAQEASLKVIEILMEFGASTSYGQPLHYAVRYDRPDNIIQYLIHAGALVNQLMFQTHLPSFYHFKHLGLGTPLHEAAHQKSKRIIRLLLRNGADPNIADTLGLLPLNGGLLL